MFSTPFQTTLSCLLWGERVTQLNPGDGRAAEIVWWWFQFVTPLKKSLEGSNQEEGTNLGSFRDDAFGHVFVRI